MDRLVTKQHEEGGPKLTIISRNSRTDNILHQAADSSFIIQMKTQISLIYRYYTEGKTEMFQCCRRELSEFKLKPNIYTANAKARRLQPAVGGNKFQRQD